MGRWVLTHQQDGFMDLESTSAAAGDRPEPRRVR